MSPQSPDAIVVGAGITGLSCARALHRAGLKVQVVERSDAVGGVVRSEVMPGVGPVDLGPQTLRSGDRDLMEDLKSLGIWDRRTVAGDAGKNRYVFWDGELVALPSGPGSFLSSPVLPLWGKLRLLMEPLVPRGAPEDLSVADFFRGRLGRHAVDRLVDPFVAGVYAGDPEGLSVDAVFGELRAGVKEKGSIVRWGISKARAAKKAREASGEPRVPTQLFAFENGLGEWPEAMADSLGPGAVQTGVEVQEAHRGPDGWTLSGTQDGHHWRAAAPILVMAVPSPVAAGILSSAYPDRVRRLKDIPYAPVSTVTLAFDRKDVEHPLDGFGCLFPSSQGRSVLGILWISSLFPGRMEDGRVVTTTFVGGARQPENALRSERWIADQAIREHREILGVSGDPVASRVTRWNMAIPQYEFGHLDRVSAAAELEDTEAGLYLAGAYRGGVSMGDCWKGGRTTASRILAEVPTATSTPVAGSS